MTEHVLHTLEDYQRALAEPRVLLFKHSPVCPISAAARTEYDGWRNGADITSAFVDVIADRALARALAERCGVKHESPQAILFERGRAVWHASHEAITRASLAAAWAERC